MGCDTILRCPVHFKGPDLDLKRLSVGADQRGVQRLVHVGLWHGNVVLKPSRNGLVHLMNHTKGCITVLDGIHDDADCKQVINLVNGLFLVDHFFINTEEMLCTAIDLGLDPHFFQFFTDVFDNGLDKGFSGAFAQSYFFHQVIIDFRL